MGQKSNASFPTARLCPMTANARSKTVKYDVDLAEPAVADGWSSRRSVRRWRPMPGSRIDYSNILPLSSH